MITTNTDGQAYRNGPLPTLTSLTNDQKCVLLVTAMGFDPTKGNEPTPDPLRDLNAAITLCDVLKAKGFHCSIWMMQGDWTCVFYKDADPSASFASPSLAAAISRLPPRPQPRNEIEASPLL